MSELTGSDIANLCGRSIIGGRPRQASVSRVMKSHQSRQPVPIRSKKGNSEVSVVIQSS